MERDTMNQFIWKCLFDNSLIPAYIYNIEQDLCEFIAEEGYTNLLEEDKDFLKKLLNTTEHRDTPVIFMEALNIFWGIFKDECDKYWIWGPVTLIDIGSDIASYRYLHKIKNSKFYIIKKSIERLSNILSLAYASVSEKEVQQEDIPIVWDGYEESNSIGIQAKDMEVYQLEKSESNRISTSTEYEEKFIKIVEEGDVTSMKKMMQINAMNFDGIGQVADKEKKKMEYLCVSCVVLVSRAAIRGGMNATEAYDLSDLYLKKLEKCTRVEEMGAICSKMQLDYTERVYIAKKIGRGNLHVEKAKDYIGYHLRKQFTVQKMADQLHVNRTYLAKIFKEQEGITIHQYLMKERCEHAANMLRFTDYSLAIIAEYFCFATQSHFGHKFKEIYHMSPNEYRKRYHCINNFFDTNK